MTGDDESDARARVGAAIRDLGHAVVGHHVAPGELDDLAATITSATTSIAGSPPRRRDPESFGEGHRQGTDVGDGQPITSYDDRPFSGRASPWGLDLRVHRHGDEIVGQLELDAAHEGAPGRSHGGIVAGLFDDIFGFVLGILQEPAFTGELKVRYERTPLACHGRLRRREGRKLWIEGELVDLEADGAPVLARAEGLFVVVDIDAMRAPTAALPAPPDEGVVPGAGRRERQTRRLLMYTSSNVPCERRSSSR